LRALHARRESGRSFGSGSALPKRGSLILAEGQNNQTLTQFELAELEHVQAFPIPGRDSQIARTVRVLCSLGMEGDDGASLQPRLA
jgi:hypothetical protein